MYIKILSSSSELPLLDNDTFLHSAEMFSMLEKTSSVTPYMLVAFNDDGTIAAHMMVILRNRRWVIPPYFLTQGRVYGCGVYANEEQREEIFQELLTTANTLFRRKRCFYVEFSDMPHKMFGYSALRSAGYFPIPWLEVRNSLHSVHPKERLTPATTELIDKAVASGVVTTEVTDYDDFRAFYRKLRSYYRFKRRRYVPAERLFYEMWQSNKARFFLTRRNGKVVGGSCCLYSGTTAFLWFLVGKRSSNHYPSAVTLWTAILNAHSRGYRHLRFLDVGLPYERSHFREFILGFGGKPISSYRWFRINIGWLNRLIAWCYRE
jgi:hypothetical protein